MRLKHFCIGAFALLASYAFAEFTGTIINLTAQGADKNVVVDVGKYDRFSVQAVVDDGTPSVHTFSDGVKASANITVNSLASGMISDRAATSITVTSPNDLDGESITLNGIVFTEGVQWSENVSTTTVAEGIRAVIDAHPDFVATRVSDIVFASATDKGTYANGWTATTTAASTKLSISSDTFLGGVNAETITINGTSLTEGEDWDANVSSDTTATSISEAINANFFDILTATPTAHVVYATAIVSGLQSWYVTSSTTSLLVAPFNLGADSDVDIDNDRITEASHGLTTGLKVSLSTATGSSVPDSLSANTTYFAIKLNENLYQLSTSAANAIAGTAIDITDVTGGGTITLTPVGLVLGQGGFTWQGSNDNSSWFVVSGTTVSFSSSTATQAWDFGEYDYKYLRMNLTGPDSGGASVVVTLHGKN